MNDSQIKQIINLNKIAAACMIQNAIMQKLMQINAEQRGSVARIVSDSVMQYLSTIDNSIEGEEEESE